MTTQTVSSGVTSSGLTESFGDDLFVLEGGVASATTVTGGFVTVLSGGSTVSTIVTSDGSGNTGQELISSGGSATGTTLLSGGFETVLSGGSALNTTVSSGGFMALGMATSSGQTLSAGGAATGTVVSGGTEAIMSGGVDTGATIVSGSQDVASGGLSLSAYVSAATSGAFARVSVSNGGIASATTIGSGGQLAIYSGGVVVDETILTGGSVYIGDGGIFTLSAGRTAENTNVDSGGNFNVRGTASGSWVGQGGTATVASGGRLTGDGSLFNFVSGTLNVQAGGVAEYFSINNGATAQVAGLVDGPANVFTGGSLSVTSGGLIRSAGVVGGVVNLSAGGVASSTLVTGGLVAVSSGGSTVSTVLSSGGLTIGQELVSSGGSTTGTVVLSGGVETVLSGGSALNVTVSSGGYMQLGIATSNGLTLSAGGNASGTIVSGGFEAIMSGGVDVGATIVSGSQDVASGGVSISAFVSAATSGAFARVSVSNGGVANATTIGSGGHLAIYSGGVVVDETILAGGAVYVGNGGIYTLSAGDTAQNISIDSGGTFNLLGTASAVSVNSGATEIVSSGGLLTGNSSSGNGVFGTLVVEAGGAADHLYVSGAGANVQLEGQLNGFANFLSGTTLTVSSGGAVSGASGSGTAMSGTADVLSGGSFEFASINGGTVNLSAGAVADHMTVSSGGNLNVAGTVRSNVAISAGGVETVLSGGAITGVTGSGTGVFAGGILNVSFGGSANHVGVSGGTFNLQGTLLSNMNVQNGGVVNVFSGGVMTGALDSGTRVMSGGRVNVLSGGFAERVRVYNRGFEIVSSGGSIGHTSIIGGTLELAAGASAGTINFSGAAGGLLKIDGAVSGAAQIYGFGAGNYIDLTGLTYAGGGTATLTSGNILHIVEGAQSFDIALNPSDDFSGKTFVLNSDGGAGTYVSMLGDLVGSGQVIAVSSGQTSNGLEIQSGGTVNVLSGGMAGGSNIYSGGVQNIYGVVSATQVKAGGREVIMSGGSGSFLNVFGEEVISAGGVADHIGVNSGGSLTVLGTLASGAIIFAGATETVSSGGVVSGQMGSGTAISGGLVNVLAGGEFDFATAYSGGILNISSGATSFNIAASSGGQVNLAGTIVSNALVAGGGIMTVSSGGVLTGSSGAGTTDYGTINVLVGGVADHIYVASGGVVNDAGVIRTNLSVQAGGVANVLSGGVISGTVYPGSATEGYGAAVGSGGALNISAGGSGMYLGVSGGGVLNVLSGGSVQRVTVSSGGIAHILGVVTNNQGILAGGLEIVSSGGFASGLAGSGTGLFGGALQVLSGGQIDRIAVYGGGQFWLSAGATGDHIAVSSGGVMYDAGALGSTVNISAGGSALIYSGGTASGINVSGGTLELAAGAAVSAVTFVGTGGELAIDGTTVMPSTVIFGFTAGNTIEFSNISASEITGITLTAGNILNVATTTFGTLSLQFDPSQTFAGLFTSAADGAGTDIMLMTSSGSVVSSGTNLTVSAGQTSNGLDVQFGGTLIVQSGGTVSGTVLNGGFELDSGSAVGTTISTGSQEIVLSGGIASNATVLSGGIQTVLSGGAAVGTTVSSMGYMQLGQGPYGSSPGSAGGTAIGTVLRGGGFVVSVGGVATSTTAMGDGVNIGGLTVFSGGAISRTTVSAGGAVTVLSGGSTASTTVLNSGYFQLGQGPFGSSPGSAGGSATGTVVSAGGTEVISSGGIDTGAVVMAGGGQTVSSGGVSISATVWGTQFVSGGTASSTTISSGGSLNIGAGATVVDESILAGGYVYIASGGVYTLSAGRVAQSIGVASGGAFNLRGSATGVYVSSGATETVSSGGVMTGNTSMGSTVVGTLNVLVGGTVDHIFVSGTGANVQLAGTLNGLGNFQSGTTLTVSSGGAVVGALGAGTVLSGGTADVLSGATVQNMAVFNGGALNVAGTVLSNVVVFSGGTETVLSGGFLSGQVYSGSGDYGTSVQGGTLNIEAGGSAAFVGVSSNGVINVAGTVLSYVAVSSGGTENVLSGGVVTGVTGSGTGVYAGGILNVSSGGSADHVGVFGGVLNLSSGGTAFNVSVSGGGVANVAGALTSNVTLLAGGLEYVSSGGSTGATSIQGGTLEIANGGLLNGDVTFAGSGGLLRIHGTAMPTGIISGFAIGNTIDLMDVNFGSGGTVSLLSGGTVLHIVENSVAYDLHLDGATAPGLRFGLSQDDDSSVLVTLHTNIAPTVAVTSAAITGAHGQATIAAAGLFTASDSDGDTITQYGFWDREGNGSWTLNGAPLPKQTDIVVDAADLAQVSYQFGAAMDTLFIRAFDGTTWSDYTQLTATPGVNQAPVVTAPNLVGNHNQTSVAAADLFTAVDPDGDTITKYGFWDREGNGSWMLNGVPQPKLTDIVVDAVDLSQVSYTFGAAMDTLFIRVFDGTTWSAYTPFTATPGVNQAPVVTVSNLIGNHNQTSVAASDLFTAADPDSDTITKYSFWDREGNGYWTLNGVQQPKLTDIIIDAADLSQVSYTFGSMPDTLFIRAFDGTAWSPYTQFTATQLPNRAPTVTASNLTGVHGQTPVAASTLFTAVDPDSDTITKYGFWDREGNGFWTVNGVAKGAMTDIVVDAADLSQVSYNFGGAPDTLFIRAFDGTTWGAWTQFTATPAPNAAPIVTVSNLTGAHGQASVAASTMFTAADPDSDTITKYGFWDRDGNGFWTVSGVAKGAMTDIVVDAADLSEVSYNFGGAPDTLFIRAFDGTTWGAWTQFTATPGTNQAPIVTTSNITGLHNQTPIEASGLFAASDPDSDTITKYGFWDREGNGFWALNGVQQPKLTDIVVDTADLSQVSYTFGAATDTLFIRAFDGTTWGAWTQLTATPGPNRTPIVTVSNVTGGHNQSIAGSSVFSAFDPDGDTITKYGFWDRDGNGHWSVNGVAKDAMTDIVVDPADLSQVSYTFGSMSDALFVRAFDGTSWSAWTQLSATPRPNQTPVVAVPRSNVIATHGQTSVSAATLFSTSDMDGDTITKYAFWDREGNGHWTVNGVAKGALTEIPVDAANLSQVSYSFGSAPDTLFIRAFDGTTWGDWTQFTATPAPNTAPVLTVSNLTGTHGQTTVAASSLFSSTDADGDTITKYEFWDREGNGHWNVAGVAQQAYTAIPVNPGDLSQVTYTFGTAMDNLFIRAFDGTTWSAWTQFTATPAPNAAPVVTAGNISSVINQSLKASNLFSATDADGDTIVKYALWDTQGNGHWTINGNTQITNAEITVNAADLSNVAYVAGPGTDQLFIRAYDGTSWGAWQQFTATGSSTATVASGATLHLGAGYNGAVAFAGSTGTLRLDNSTSFAGTVAGMAGTDALDLTDINFATIQTPTFDGDSSGGTLSVTDGVHTASITLLGNYLASTFTTSSNGHGGTLVVDPPANNNSILSPPQTA